MDEKVMQHTVGKFLDASDGILFAFQGGEPTLSGSSFFKKFFSLVDARNTKGKPVRYALQTNGYLIPEDLIPLLQHYHVLVGVSLDGPRQLHNYHRHDRNGNETFTQVRNTLRSLKGAGLEVNLLSVVTNETADNADKVMQFFQRMGESYLQFIPCLSPLQKGEDENPFLSPAKYLSFLETVWKYWISDGRLSIRLFDNWLTVAMGQRPEACGARGICSVEYVVEADGSVYPCDFYCLEPYLLGNIADDSIKTLDRRREQIRFVESSLTNHFACEYCAYLPYCGGGCRRYRKSDGTFVYCEVYSTFLNRHMGELRRIASRLMKTTTAPQKP